MTGRNRPRETAPERDWSETVAVDARDVRKPPASETGAADDRDKRRPPPSETGAGDARDRPKPPPSETGAGDATGRNRPRARRARGTLVTGGRDKWRRCVSRTNPLLRSCGLLGFALWNQPGSTLKMFMLSTLGQTKGRTNIRTADLGLRRLCLRLVSDRRQTHQVTEACPHRAPALFAAQTPMCF